MQGTWMGSLVAAVVLLVFLYLPGYWALQRTRLPRVFAMACAPLISVAAYALIAVAFDKMGVACSGWLLFAVALLGAVAALLIGRVLPNGRRDFRFAFGKEAAFDWGSLGLYVGCGVIATVLLFVANLDGPTAFIQEYDNVFHLAVLRSFMETGAWSTLSVSPYASPESVSPLATGAGFYPAGWHVLVAMVADGLQVEVSQSVNVVNGVFVGVVFPAAMLSLMSTIFPDRRRVVRMGALATVSLAAFPWKFLFWGPLFPNMAAFCLLPAVVAVFMRLISSGMRKECAISLLVVFLLGCVSAALCQPNAIFTATVFLTPFCTGKIYEAVLAAKRARWEAFAAAAGFLCAVIGGWFVLFNLPALQSTVWHEWGAGFSKTQSLVNVAFLSLSDMNAQIVLGIAVLAGLFLLLVRRHKCWLLVSTVLLAYFYCVSITTNDWIQHFLTGFWYTDPRRLAANLVLCTTPLASICLAWLADRLQRVAVRHRPESRAAIFSVVTVSSLFVLLVFFPSFELKGFGDVRTAFTQVRDGISHEYTMNHRVLDTEEAAFVEKVAELVDDGGVIVNEPNDGSAFAYGTDGINVLYRNTRGYGGASEKEASTIVRERLDEVATDPEVQQAVKELGAQYVLQLDQGDTERKSPYLFTYNPDLWPGIYGITDETPGFELMLSEGDMRLYKITAV